MKCDIFSGALMLTFCNGYYGCFKLTELYDFYVQLISPFTSGRIPQFGLGLQAGFLQSTRQQLRRVVCLLMNTVVQRLVGCVSCWFNSAMLLVLVSMVCRSVFPLWIRNTHILVLRFFYVHLTGVSLWW